MIILLIFIIGILLCLLIAWCLGANDAANPTDCAVGSGAISMKKAIILFAVFAAIGGILLGPFVMKTVDRGIVPKEELPERTVILGSFAAVTAAGSFLILCTWKGMPTSTTHSIIGGVLGFGLIACPHLVKWDIFPIIIFGLVAAPFLSMLVATGLFFAFRAYFRKLRKKRTNLLMSYLLLFALGFAVSLAICQKVLKWPLLEALGTALLGAAMLATLCVLLFRKRWEKTGMRGIMISLLIVALCFSAFAFGANDMANATGAFVTPTEVIMGKPTTDVMFMLAALGSIGIAVGGLTWGYRVLNTSAFKVTRLDPLTGLAGEYSNALTIFLFTVVPMYLIGFGMPVSTTHSSIGSIIGVGLASKGLGGVDKRTVGKIFSTWGLTIPCTALLSMAFFGLFNIIIPA